ncbi:hypothetical protein F5Y18DRAFT_438340 [Xylariaceae sp. FL1019]|nr:hypothetical protein F5Y18DRAFT_438340 [Xylariaceae sp. FL1019]
MTDRHGSLSYPPNVRRPSVDARKPSNIERGVRAPSVSTAQNPYNLQVRQRRNNIQAVIENPLSHLTDEELKKDVEEFQRAYLHSVDLVHLHRAAQLAKDIRSYDAVARSSDPNAGIHLPVQLSPKEKDALKIERDKLPSEPTMLIVILTVSLAAFLQGFVQSSINGASLFPSFLHLAAGDNWKIGAANASPFLFAALLGCPLALPVNYHFGRRGAIIVAACLIFASSLGAVWCDQWYKLFGLRVINGVGMGIKAVSTPILASETAVGYWRGTSILAWQLWVAFGIFVGFAFNLIFYTAHDDTLTPRLILGAPLVPSLFLLGSLYFCPESPRFYMRQRSSHFNPSKAYAVLKRLRTEEIQALRDIYLIYKSVQQEEHCDESDDDLLDGGVPHGFTGHAKAYAAQYKELFSKRRLRNALISSSIVALAQQLCGINILAFYSGPLFRDILHSPAPLYPMLYSLGYGATNFVFGLPAIRTIDTLGRRKWLVITLPIMCIFMTAAAVSTLISSSARGPVVAVFVFLFAAAYSPGMGPIPFTLASESFPLSNREAGCAFAIAINLLFAGLLSILFPSIDAGLKDGGTLGLFAGLNFVAFVLVFLLVEETKRRSLEDLDSIFAVKKWKFTRYQVTEYIPWFFRCYFLRRAIPRPELYVDLIWGKHRSTGSDEEAAEAKDWPNDDNTLEGGLFNTTPFGHATELENMRRPSNVSRDDDHW